MREVVPNGVLGEELWLNTYMETNGENNCCLGRCLGLCFVEVIGIIRM